MNPHVLYVEARARARPQGSYSRGANGRIYPAAKGLAAWKADIAKLTYVALYNTPDVRFTVADAIGVHILFLYARPRNHYRSAQGTLTLRADAPHAKTTTPDIDKLARAILDGLVLGGAFPDDKQVASLNAEKSWGNDGDRVEIRVRRLDWSSPYDYVTTP